MDLRSVTIAIVLSTALVFAVASYLGGIFEEASVRADAATMTSEAQQIVENLKAAQALRGHLATDLSRSDHCREMATDNETGLEMLEECNMIDSAPEGWDQSDGAIDASSGQRTEVHKNACKIINKEVGYEGDIPSCEPLPEALQGRDYYCCQD